VSRGRLVVHAHFYQPSRIDPFSGRVPADPSAAPAHDWTARVSAECYRPNAEIGNLGHISWDLGPTLAAWMRDGDPVAYRGFVAGDRGINAMAQPYHHPILPLASAADRRTEIRWGLRDFELRFGRPAAGMWLPEAAVDLATLRLMADHGVEYTLLAPWQAVSQQPETRRPYRVDLGTGRSIVVALYDAALSSSVSFEPAATRDADRFARERLVPRVTESMPDDERPLLIIATDGELYGHHQSFRELFLKRLVQPGPDGSDLPFDVGSLAQAVREQPGRPFRTIRIVERTSWSCHHGVLRWSGACPCAEDAGWKAPLRSALERLAAGVDAITERLAARLPGSPDPWAARDAYVDVVVGAEDPATFAAHWLGDGAARADTALFLNVMETQRWRLAMFASDAWFWDDPVRTETMGALRAAAWVARRIDGLAGAGLERRLVADLATFTSAAHNIDGAEIYRRALTEVGQAVT
jgi:hypothetical protein